MAFKSSSTHFSKVATIKKPRSVFPLNRNLKTSFNTSFIYPIYCKEVLPGDTVNFNMSNFIRQNPTVTPVMDNLWGQTAFFFVPNRLGWDNWQKFNGERKNPTDSIDFLIPQVVSPVSTGWSFNSVASYLGVRQGIPSLSHSALPLRAYNRVCNDWFRDTNIQNSAVENTGDGPDTDTDYPLFQINKFPDYFTTARTAPQNGPSVMIPQTYTTNPLTSTAPLVGVDIPFDGTASGNNFIQVRKSDGTLRQLATAGAAGDAVFGRNSTSGTGELVADLSDVTLTSDVTATINALRNAEAIQTLLETDMRGGALYTQMIFAHFGVVSPDARLQRSEYLGGNKVNVNMSPVMQTSQTDTTPQGNLAGMGVLQSHDTRFIKSFTEHGYIIGVFFARSDIHYQQGTERHWFRQSRYDYYLPELANLGEQPILNREIFTQGTSADSEAFGYTERWAEMKSDINVITGVLNSDTPSSLDVWHYGQDFSALPLLNTSFLKDGTPELRIQSVTTEPSLIGEFQFDTNWTRVMPAFSIPGWSARF